MLLTPKRRTAAWFFLAAIVANLTPSPAHAQPTIDFAWNNFTGVATTWSTAANWVGGIAPTSGIDRVLGFSSSSLQTAGGYTSTFDSVFDLNSLVFTSQGASNPSMVITGNAAGNTLQFNTSSTGLLPSIWQSGTGRVVIQNGTATNGMTLNNGTTLQILGSGIGELQLNANIVQAGAGNSGLLINQTGTRALSTGSLVRLAGNNTFAGGVNLTAGNLILASNTALGTGTFTVNGGTVQIDPATITGLTIANAMTLNSTLNITGNNNPATAAVNANAAIPAATANGLFSGAIGGTGGITIANNNSNFSTGGFATMVYGLTGANTFQGAVTVAPFGNTATLLSVGMSAVSTGTVSGSTAINVSWAGTFRLDNTAGVLTRLNTTTAPALNLSAGTVQLYGNATANAAETFGTLTLGGGGNITILGASATAQTNTLTFGSLSRPTNGTLAINATNLGSGTAAGEAILRFTTDPGNRTGGTDTAGSPAVRILPYAAANAAASTSTATANVNAGLVRWDSASQRIVPLTNAEYATNLFTAGTTTPNDNHRYLSTAALPNAFGVAGLNSATTVNSLVLDTNTAATNRVGVSISGSGTLTVGGGAILSAVNGGTAAASNPSMINLGGLNFGANPGYVHTLSNLTINAPISGTGGVVKGGPGLLLLNGANAFVGGLTVNGGLVQFSSDANLGAAGQSITLQGGSAGGLQYLPPTLWTGATSGALTVNRPITVGAGGGNITVTALNTSLTLSGSLSGSGQVYKTGTGVLNLTGDNSAWTGTLTTFSGVTAVQNDAALGGAGATINLTNGVFQPLTSFTTNKDFLVAFQSFINTGGQNLTLTGNIASQNSSAAILKTGLGDLNIMSASTHSGSYQNGLSSPASVVFATTGNGVQTSGRTVLSGPNGSIALAASVFSIANGEVVMDNTAAVNNNRIGNVTVSLVGGNVTLLGNATAPVNEAVGAISFSNANNPYGGTLTLSTPAGSGQSTTLNALSLSANTAGGTIFVRGTNLGANSGDRTALVFGTTPTQINGLIPSLVGATSATAEPTDFLTLSTITVGAPNSNQFSVLPFSAYTPGAGALGAGAAANTYNVTAPSSFTAGAAANALKMNGTTLDLGAGTLTLGAGAVLSTGGAAASIGNGTMAFGANPARFTVTTGSDLTVSASTTGTAGLIKTGNGVLTLNTASAIAVTAGTSFYGVGQGTLRYGVANALTSTANVFVNGGATLDINGTTSTVGNLNGYGNVAIGSGSLTVGSIAQIVIFGGALSGDGTFIKNTTGITTTLAGDSTAGFTGGVQVLGGTLSLSTPGAIGTGTSPLLLGNTSGAVQSLLTLGPLVTNFSRDITVQAGSTPTTAHTITAPAGISTISGNIVINNTAVSATSGGFTLAGVGLQLNGTTGAAGGNANQTGVMSGPGGVYVFSGNWTFSGNNTYSGGTFLDTTTAGGFGIGIDSTPTAGVVTSGPFGTGAVSFSTGFGMNLRADGGARTIANQINLSSTGGYFGVAGTNPLTLNGPVNLQAATVAQTFNIMNTATTTIGGVIQNGTGGIIKNGPGVLNLTGNNTYTGTTTVNAGTLLVNNSTGNAAAAVTVNSGAILGGSGSIGGPLTVTAGGIVSPGNSPGTLTVNGNAQFQANSTFAVEINGVTAGTQHDQLVVSGPTVDINGALLNIRLGYSPTPGGPDFFFIVNNTGANPIQGTFAGLPNGSSVALGNGITATISYFGDVISTLPTGGNDIVLFAPVPEPTTILSLAAAGLGMAGYVRRRRLVVSRSELKS